MTAEQFARAREIFLQALNQPEPERLQFVSNHCAGNADLQREVEDLLAAHIPTIGPVETVASVRSSRAPEHATVHFNARPEIGASSKSRAPTVASARDLPPGTLIADRYRIVSRLGAGGMGEVFRADDLTLEQSVALKFLPRGFARSPAWIARLRQEARLARTVTHPNICRVHDLVESSGEYFLTMEYVDGEDLASLYRRIGRLPVDRALDVARQICLGLAVAHSKNVLHRDLKPQNIMIDGQGQVRITDFGVAALAHEIPEHDIRTGTAAYMSPEQITGRGVSEKSDLYALGLVMFELFTGHQAFQADSIAEFARLHEQTSPPTPSQVAQDIPAEVEQVILQCLEKNPDARPASAMVIAARLPGRNVLDAVVAANLTPSPDVVAVAQVSRTRVSSYSILGLTAALIAGTWFLRVQSRSGWDHLGTLPPGAMRERARTLLDSIQPDQATPFSAYGYCDWLDVASFAEEHVPSEYRLAHRESESGLPVFWYRESQNPLSPSGVDALLFGAGRATMRDPPPEAGSMTVFFDDQGRLFSMVAIPDWLNAPESEPGPSAFEPLLRAAGLAALTVAERTPNKGQNLKNVEAYEWHEAGLPNQAEARMAVGLSVSGQPVWFATSKGAAGGISDRTRFSLQGRREVVQGGLRALFLVVMAVALPWAWRGYWSGRIDRDGAVRLALAVMVLELTPTLLTIPRATTLGGEILRLCIAILRALGLAAAVAVLYSVVDLYTRRFWPDILITWNRVLRGQFRDPAVRRHVALGACVGCFWTCLVAGERVVVELFGWTVRPFLFGDRMAAKLYGLRDALASLTGSVPVAIGDGLLFLLLLILVRMVTRSPKWAMGIASLCLIPLILPRGAHVYTTWLFMGVCGIGSYMLLITRAGLLAVVVAFLVVSILTTIPLTSSLQHWCADLSMLGLAPILALALWGVLDKKRSMTRQA